MAKYQGGLTVDLSLIANADLSAKQYHFVTAGSVAGEVKACSTAAGSVLGVLQNDPKQGEEATVRIMGPTLLTIDTDAGASAVTYGGFLTCASQGMARGNNPVYATCCFVPAIALEAVSTGSGVVISAILLPPLNRWS